MNLILKLKPTILKTFQQFTYVKDGSCHSPTSTIKLLWLQLPRNYIFERIFSPEFGFLFYTSHHLFFIGLYYRYHAEIDFKEYTHLTEEVFFHTLSTLYIEEIRIFYCRSTDPITSLFLELDIQLKAFNCKFDYYLSPEDVSSRINPYELNTVLFSSKELQEMRLKQKTAFVEYVCLDSPFLYSKTSDILLNLDFDTEYGPYNGFESPKDSPLKLSDRVVLNYVLQGFDFLYCTGQILLKNLHTENSSNYAKAEYIYHIMTGVFTQIVGLEVCMLHWSERDDCLYFWFGVSKEFDFETTCLLLGNVNIVVQGELGVFGVVSSFMAEKMEYSERVTQMNRYFVGVYNRENEVLHAKLSPEGRHCDLLLYFYNDFFSYPTYTKEEEERFLREYEAGERRETYDSWVWEFVLYRNKIFDNIFAEGGRDVARTMIWYLKPFALYKLTKKE